MKRQRIIKAAAGFFILSGILLSIYVHPNWLWLSAFVGLNLFQYAFTNWCMMDKLLIKFGIQDSTDL